MALQEFHFPTEVISLPSQGYFYPAAHPLASGQIELYYMTAKHEDILTSQNLIKRGIVIDKLLEALIVNKDIKLDDILLGDKAAIMLASRILGYGKNYDVSINCPECGKKSETTLDLQKIDTKECPYFTEDHRGHNEFTFTLPVSKKEVTFKFLTHADEKAIRNEIEMLKRVIKSDVGKEMTTRIRKSILSVDGETDGEIIRKFIETMPAMDSKALRDHIKTTAPDVDLKADFTCAECGHEGRVDIPIDISFFWPNAGV